MVFPIFPPWKKARYAKPTEVQSLKKLAMNAFVEELQDELVLDVSKFPAEFGGDLWERMSSCEIIETALNSNAVDWFSKNVIDEPRSMSVDFLEILNLGTVELRFAQRETLRWSFEKGSKRKDSDGSESVDSDDTESEDSDDSESEEEYDEDRDFDIKIGDHVLKTRVDNFAANLYNTDGIVSFLPSTDFKVRYDIVQWLCKFFRCKVKRFQFGDSEFCKYWDLSEEPGGVEISTCTDLDFVERVLPERQRKNLSTRISELQIAEPINITTQSIQHAKIGTAYLNFTTSNSDTIIMFYKELLPKIDKICTKISNWTVDELKTFKSELELDDFFDELLETYCPKKFMEGSDKKMFKKLSSRVAAVVYVHEKEPGVYDKIGCTLWWK